MTSVDVVQGWLCALLVLVVAGCGATEDDPNGAVTPPSCRVISSFGSAEACDEVKPGAPSCEGGAGFCAGGWLCFHSTKEAFCSCDVDSDCQRRADYINQARALRKLAP
ncbi:MAG TPA: hypothetical protein DCQ06_08065, partial [Myxococcales bacterium]|nr:hypothetical protein [Myxococcales bacterium]